MRFKNVIYNVFRFILPGSIIVSKAEEEFKGIEAFGGGLYEHQVVHGDNPDAHTKNIEGTWLSAKKKLGKFENSDELFTSKLYEFIWRNKFKNKNIFSEFIVCIIEQFPF